MASDQSSTTGKAPRLPLSAASAITWTLVLLICGGAWWWRKADQQSRAIEAESSVRQAIADGREALQEGRTEDALLAVSSVPASSPSHAEALTIQGMAEATRGNSERTRALLEKSLALAPNQPMALKVLAAVEFDDNEPDRGLKLLARAAELDPTDFRPWYASGATMLRLGDRFPAAIPVFREALKRQPDHGPSRLGLAEALVGAGETEESGSLIDVLLRENPYDPRVFRLAARRAKLLGDEPLSRRLAENALALDPNDGEARVLRGQSLLQSGDPRGALEEARLASGLAPRDTSALALGTRAAGALGFKEEADSFAKQLSQTREQTERVNRLRTEVVANPEQPGLRLRLGQAAAEAGLISLARRSFQAALEREPTSLEARQGLESLGRTSP